MVRIERADLLITIDCRASNRSAGRGSRPTPESEAKEGALTVARELVAAL